MCARSGNIAILIIASKFRALLMTQEVKLLQPAPWGPYPLSKSLVPFTARSVARHIVRRTDRHDDDDDDDGDDGGGGDV